LHFLLYLLNICRKFEFLIFRGSVATSLKVRWVMSYGFRSKCHTLSCFQHCKNFENRLRFDKLQRVKRWELFLRHSVSAGWLAVQVSTSVTVVFQCCSTLLTNLCAGWLAVRISGCALFSING